MLFSKFSESGSAEGSVKAAETGEVAATCVIVGIHLDTTVRKALPLPSDVRERASRLIGDNDTERSAFNQLLTAISA